MKLTISGDYQYANHDGVLTIFTDAFSSRWKGLLSLVLDTDLRPPLYIEVLLLMKMILYKLGSAKIKLKLYLLSLSAILIYKFQLILGAQHFLDRLFFDADLSKYFINYWREVHE